jgi:hypothetical protein
MKTIQFKLITIVLAGVLAISFQSCEKNEIIKPTNNTSEYVIKNPEWKLSEANHINKNGAVGNLYINKNNPIETLFKQTSLLKASTDDFTGTYSKKFENGICVGYICQAPKKNCKVNIQKDGSGNIIGVKITVTTR